MDDHVVRRELPWEAPAEVAKRLYDRPGFVWLDSACTGHASARYSYIAADPVSRFSWPQDGCTTDFKTAFRTWQNQFQIKTHPDDIPFQGGAIGYVSYDAADIWMPGFRSRHPRKTDETVAFSLYDTVLAFDHTMRRMVIFSAGLSNPGAPPDKKRALRQIEQVAALLQLHGSSSQMCDDGKNGWSPLAGQSHYADLVGSVREAILEGEVYQANVAGLWTRPAQTMRETFHTYLRLRTQTQAPFSAFAVFDGRTLSSFSPERLLEMDRHGHIRTEPIKGTARRSRDPRQDEAIAEALMLAEKDRAENIMIVDLMRNDLSKVCQPGSIDVTRLCCIESLPNLHHLVSTVEGQLLPGHDATDLLGAVFPGGSVTGAPKLRAMEIIDALEPTARGAFCGALGYIGFDGACDFNIMIRTIDHLPGEARYWSGAGITLLSDAEVEWAEVRLKAERILSFPRSSQVT